MRAALPMALLVLASCSQPAQKSEGADDFANRVGTGKTAPAPAETTAAKAPPPANADIFKLEKLGNIGGVDLGPRAGGCTFSTDGTEMLTAAGPADTSLPGKATVRVGGKLLLLDAPPGGYDKVKAGTTFTGEGFTVQIQPAGAGKATLTVTNAEGQSKTFGGRYACS